MCGTNRAERRVIYGSEAGEDSEGQEGVHADGDWAPGAAEAVQAEIRALADWLGLEIAEE